MAFERKWKVAVVTNPLFPSTAIEQRLDWAGLPPRANPFDLITSYEESHFAKPHPEYLAEALAHLGSQPEETLLVGDDLEMDIRPAQRLGLRTFWVTGEMRRSGDGSLSAGSLADLYQALLDNGDTCGQINPPDPMALPHVMRGHLGAVLTAFSRHRAWSIGPLDADWSPTEIACHLRDVEREITQPRIEMLTGDENLPPRNPDPTGGPSSEAIAPERPGRAAGLCRGAHSDGGVAARLAAADLAAPRAARHLWSNDLGRASLVHRPPRYDAPGSDACTAHGLSRTGSASPAQSCLPSSVLCYNPSNPTELTSGGVSPQSQRRFRVASVCI
jgi:hypothetical protein